MAEIRSFRELNVYKTAREAARATFEISKTFPREERYSLSDQIRRSSRAMNAMIAEASAKRRYETAFTSKINDALGEATETQSWLDHARDSDYITSAQFAELDASWQQIGGMLHKMTERSSDFWRVPKR
jgi:four helix bundle protein